MSYLFFLLVNATLFIRPAEIVPALLGLPIYNGMMISALVTSAGPVLAQLSQRSLGDRPVSVCVLGMFASILLSHLVRFDFFSAQFYGTEFLKVVLYYLLLLAVLDTPARFRCFLNWLVLFAVILAGLALLHFHGFVNIPALEALERKEYDAEGDVTGSFLQLRSTGIYNDPNDLCLILIVGMLVCLHRLFCRKGLFRLAWLVPMGLFFYALVMTRSRGGFLGFLASLAVLLVCRYGWRRALPLAMVTLPGLLFLVGGRQTAISTEEDTAQHRIQLWHEGFQLLARSPLTGIGAGQFVEEMGYVAHNSFVHSYTELGFLGGTMFLGIIYLPIRSLYRLRPGVVEIHDPEMRSFRPYMLAMLVGYATGMFSLSRCYIVPTYMIAGLASSYLQVTAVTPPEAMLKADPSLAGHLAMASVGLLIFLFVFIRFSVNYG